MSVAHVVSTGAWDVWRDEVRAGRRTADFPADALYFAAYCDAMGLDRLDDGELHLAAMWFAESERWMRIVALAGDGVAA